MAGDPWRRDTHTAASRPHHPDTLHHRDVRVTRDTDGLIALTIRNHHYDMTATDFTALARRLWDASKELT